MTPSERTLLLLRHAKSAWPPGVDDHDRPLTERGRRDAAAVGRLLADRGLIPDLVLCSTAVRARQTWDGAAAAGAEARELRLTPEIYEASLSTLMRLVQGLGDAVRVALLVGHGPGLPELAEELGGPVGEKYATSGLATLRLTDPWSSAAPGSASLVGFDVPRG